MKDIYILGIESSCDETSISIIKNGIEEISTITSTQIDIHKDYGGVVPEIASRNHIKNVTIVLEECLNKANMTLDDIDNIEEYVPDFIKIVNFNKNNKDINPHAVNPNYLKMTKAEESKLND